MTVLSKPNPTPSKILNRFTWMKFKKIYCAWTQSQILGVSFHLAFSSTIWGLCLRTRRSWMGNSLPIRFSKVRAYLSLAGPRARSKQPICVEIPCREFIGQSSKELFRVEEGQVCLRYEFPKRICAESGWDEKKKVKTIHAKSEISRCRWFSAKHFEKKNKKWGGGSRGILQPNKLLNILRKYSND